MAKLKDRFLLLGRARVATSAARSRVRRPFQFSRLRPEPERQQLGHLGVQLLGGLLFGRRRRRLAFWHLMHKKFLRYIESQPIKDLTLLSHGCKLTFNSSL